MDSTTKHRILHPPGQDLVGILHRASPSSPTQGQPIALIIHGVLAHKDQSYHSLLARRLADERGLDSFRYDLRGQGGESEGKWEMTNFDDDVKDLERVISWLEKEYGYRIHLLVGHSRGSMLCTYFLSTRPHAPVPLFVNVSGRYHMARILENRKYDADFEKQGYQDWNVKIAGKQVSRRMTPEGIRSFAEWDNSYLISSFPQEMEVLSIHGDGDLIVPVEDAHSYHKILSQRSPGTHTLKVISGPGHNWTRPFDEPVNGIMAWLEAVDSRRPKSKM